MSQRFWLAAGLALVVLSTATPAFADCNTNPTALNDSVATFDDREVLIDPLANDSDPDGQPLSVALGNETCNGDIMPIGDLVSYQPVLGQAENCTIQYTADDGTGGDSATISITVTVLTTDLFADSFEGGNTNAWTSTSP